MNENGRKNCRVIGKMRARSTRVETAVLKRGPGEAMMQREKMPRMARTRYWPS